MLKRFACLKLTFFLILLCCNFYNFPVCFDHAVLCHSHIQSIDTGDQRKIEGSAETSKIEDFINEWVAMWNSYDLDQVEHLFLNSDQLSYFSSEKEGVIKGFKNVVNHHIGFGFVKGGKQSTSRLWLDQVNFSSHGPTKIVTAIWYFQKKGGPVQKGPVTFVCLEDTSGYKFVHLNFGNYKEKNWK